MWECLQEEQRCFWTDQYTSTFGFYYSRMFSPCSRKEWRWWPFLPWPHGASHYSAPLCSLAPSQETRFGTSVPGTIPSTSGNHGLAVFIIFHIHKTQHFWQLLQFPAALTSIRHYTSLKSQWNIERALKANIWTYICTYDFSRKTSVLACVVHRMLSQC